MSTVLVDKNNNVINHGDKVMIKSSLTDYPSMYHYGIYSVWFDHLRGLTLHFEELVDNNDKNNQTIGTYELRINEHLYLWRWDSDPENVYVRFNVEGNRCFVKIESTNDIEKVI
jgi:hypothetical protein